MRPRAEIAALLTCGALGLGAIAAGCGSGDSDSTASAAPVSAGEVDIADFKYDPETISVEPGTKVTWTNSDRAAHTATADDGTFDTGDLDRGDAKSVTFDKAGSFTYYCRFHPFMKATVEVQ